MLIACNVRLLKKNKLDGIGWFTHESLKRITQNHPEHEFLFISDHPLDSEFIYSGNIRQVVIPPPARHPFLWYIWLEWSLPRILKKYKPDVFLSPDGFLSLSSNIPSLPVIHDINFHHRPMDLPFFNRFYYRYFFPRFAEKADLIATVSEYSGKDIIQSYGIPEDKIHVVYNGVHELYRPLDNDEKEKTRKLFSNGCPYFVFIGTLHPRKNIINLLKAFDTFRSSVTGIKLIIVGDRMFKTGEITTTWKGMKHRADVIFTGRHEPSTLHKILGAAEALTYFPYYEGFGIPLVEAMYSEVPILASNVTSIPEVAGKAAVYAGPDNIKAMAELMHRIVMEKDLRNKLINEGRIQRQQFSWDKTADALWEVIVKTVNATGRC